MDIRQLRIMFSKRQVTNEISPVVAPDNYLAVQAEGTEAETADSLH